MTNVARESFTAVKSPCSVTTVVAKDDKVMPDWTDAPPSRTDIVMLCWAASALGVGVP